MNSNLIAVTESTINNEVVQTVNARELHTFLEVKSRFSDWFHRQVELYGFTQDVDFIAILVGEYSPPRKDYHISIDMAKELSMVERTDKGKEARQYFIACEKKLKETLSPAEFLLHQAQMMVAVEREQKRQAEELRLIAERQRITEVKIEDFANGAEHFSITAYNKLFRNNQISHSEANKDGRNLSKIARDNGIQLGKAPHPTFGTVHTYPKAMMDSFYRGEYH